MMKYHFIPQEDENPEFFFDASSFNESIENPSSCFQNPQ